MPFATKGGNGDNNGAIAGIGGFNLPLMGGNRTILALTHVGPDQASRALAPNYNADGYNRYLSDVVVTYKANDKLTLTTEVNWARDDFGYFTNPGKPVNSYGAAQYLSHALNDQLALNARAELWRDDSNVFVAAFSGNSYSMRAQKARQERAGGTAPGPMVRSRTGLQAARRTSAAPVA